MSAWHLAALAVAALVSATCAAADGALLSAATIAEARSADAAEGERLHRALASVRVVALLACGAFAALVLDEPGTGAGRTLTRDLVAMFLLVGAAELVARAVGDALGARAWRALRAFAAAARVLGAPAVWLGDVVDAYLVRVLPPGQRDREDRETATEQFREVVAAEAAQTSAEGENLVHGVFTLGDTTVEELMVPRVDMIGIEHDSPWSEVVDRVRSSEHARFPVYTDSIDEIVGILFAKDLLAPVLADAPPAEGWQRLVRPAVFIPSGKRAADQLREFKQTHTHIAIVVDEYGGTAGLVTIEDVLEEIVGEIRDEYDEEEPELVAEEGRRYWASGRLPLDDLSEALRIDVTSDEVTTVGGLVYEQLGHVPRSGERFTLGSFRVVVERVRRRKVERVYFERAGDSAAALDTAGEDA